MTIKPALDLYQRTPLYLRIVAGLVLGAVAGHFLGKDAESLKPISDIVLQFLRLLATPLIFIALAHSLYRANIGGRMAGKLLWLLMTNTVVAIVIGLLVANVLQPGTHVALGVASSTVSKKPFDIGKDLLDKLPTDLVSPFAKNEIISVIVLAAAIGIALRIVKYRQLERGEDGYLSFEKFLDTSFELVMVMLHWIFQLVPLAVFAVVARTVGTSGINPILQMGWFVGAVAIALALQALFYLARLRLGSSVRPGTFLKGGFDAFAMAFSTASSAATLPITFAAAKDKMGVREESASLGVMVGGTFNHDGTALYEAMAALFISQALGKHLSIQEQILVVLMAIVASVGAAGIPEAGLVTMIAVFNAVHLPIEYIPFLLPLDWILDRCRTTINVMGDLSVTCLLDGRRGQTEASTEPA
jgi:DAACS family dicarboxylate/amino acid:cation (Na+ or H+) symporter